MRRRVTLLAAVFALASPSHAVEVSVCGDATYDVPEDRGVICASADPVPPGTACPLKGDKASADCFENLPSYDGGACVAPEDAVCALVTDKAWGCVLPSVGCGNKPLTPAAPASPVALCETWDYEGYQDSASSIDADSLFDGNEGYDESWFVKVTEATELFTCGVHNPAAAPTSEPTLAPTSPSEPTPAPTDTEDLSASTNASGSEPTPAPTADTEDSSASEPTPAPSSDSSGTPALEPGTKPTSDIEDSSSSDSTETATQDSGDASMPYVTPVPSDISDLSSGITGPTTTPSPTSTTTKEPSETALSGSEDSSTSDTTDSSESMPTSDITDESAFEPTPAPSETADSSTSDSSASVLEPTPVPTSKASMAGSTDASTPEVTPAATRSETQQDIEDTQSSAEANEDAGKNTTTKQTTGFTDVTLLSDPSSFIATLKPAAIPEAQKAYDKPSRW